VETHHLSRDRYGEMAQTTGGFDPFGLALAKDRLKLDRRQTVILQVNTGLLCNQTCRHCHLDAGPGRTENLDAQTAKAIVAYAARARFEVIDITGGAPELNPNFEALIEGCAASAPRIMVRSNLSALFDGRRDHLLEMMKDHKVVIVASFPSINEIQADAQRGDGVFRVSVDALKRLNAAGYGVEGSGLELNLVSNPAGAFLPNPQEKAEKRFRDILERKWSIRFNHLHNFANVPLGRFRDWLARTGNLEGYLQKLAAAFNPCALDGVMCRTLVSVGWDGYLYDCDFNLAGRMPMGGRRVHVSQMPGAPEPGSPIAVADHCYTCTAGAGFT